MSDNKARLPKRASKTRRNIRKGLRVRRFVAGVLIESDRRMGIMKTKTDGLLEKNATSEE
jgi:hypothetical protein